MSTVAHQAQAYPGYCSMQGQEVFCFPKDGDASTLQGYTSSSKFASTNLYISVERGSVTTKQNVPQPTLLS